MHAVTIPFLTRSLSLTSLPPALYFCLDLLLSPLTCALSPLSYPLGYRAIAQFADKHALLEGNSKTQTLQI